MFTANRTTISTYSIKSLCLDLGLRRAFQWKFVIANVAKPVIGADFLPQFGLLIDLRLLDTTSLATTGRIAAEEADSMKTIASDSPYHQLLAKYPDLTRLIAIPRKVKHDVIDHINTMPSPPNEPGTHLPFQEPVGLRPSHGSENGWRPCGDYRALNSQTVLNRYRIHISKIHISKIFRECSPGRKYSRPST
ncbi:hypothetical protein WN51_07925 [Melipona quadrifasciata]|uniref:Uncharacterized protein n=1 Tax=Melipona quadrifasciata TaxID=166423 RepID=A0A0N0U381_9HYME|nr:hypothetical protein WN51_07925 [Melipona quadrifasciata]